MKKQAHGGPRKGAGRPAKYGEETTTVSFRVPTSLVKKIKKMIRDLLGSSGNKVNL
jgi:hypothetical protein